MSAEMRLPWVMGALSLRPRPDRYRDPAAAIGSSRLIGSWASARPSDVIAQLRYQRGEHFGFYDMDIAHTPLGS